MRLANLTWPKAQEYFEKNDMVLVSIGSIECHGRHIPLGTDTLIPEHLLEKIEKKSDVLIAPTIPYGACQSLAPYPGTIDIDNEVLYQYLQCGHLISCFLAVLVDLFAWHQLFFLAFPVWLAITLMLKEQVSISSEKR